MKWVDTTSLKQWAEQNTARADFPGLVGNLILATLAPDEILEFRFPKGTAAQAPGYDGQLLAANGRFPIPEGNSIWEFGTGGKYLDKANSDYKKRTMNPGGVDPTKTTFVFVTPHVWVRPRQTIEKWANSKRNENFWKDVKVVDGIGLETWLEQCPAVAREFARSKLRIAPQSGVRSVSEYWDEYSNSFDPQLTEDVLICGREGQAKEAIEQLAGEPQSIYLQADSLEEVVAFTVASIRKAEDEIRRMLESRTLILDTVEAARQLATDPQLIFIANSQAAKVSGMLSRSNVTVIPLGRMSVGRDRAKTLNRPSHREFGKSLETMGYEEDQALQLARECARLITVLRRQKPSGAIPAPSWVEEIDRTLMSALLGNAWDSSSPADQEVLHSLSDHADYPQYETALMPMLKSRNKT